MEGENSFARDLQTERVDHIEQPAQKFAERLMAWSRYQRSTVESPDCVIQNMTNPDERYTISRIREGQDPRTQEVQELMESRLGPDEVDTLQTLQEAIDDKDIPYKVYVVADKDGKTVSVVTCGQLDILDAKSEPSGDTVLMGAYAITTEEYEKRGLAKEAYISALVDNIADARERHKTLAYSSAENVETAERFSNAIGRKRVYIQTGDIREYTELPYVQPALDFNKKTGKPLKRAGSVPEHLMVHRFDGHTPPKDQIAGIVQAFYDWNNFKDRNYFHSNSAYQEHRQHIEGILGEFRDFLANNGQIILLSPQSREKALHIPSPKQPLTIHPHPKMES